MVRKYIPIPINEKNNFNKENYLNTYINRCFCKYIFKRGVYEGQLCNIKCYENNYCKKHFKLIERKINSENERKKITKCAYVSNIYKCTRRCIEGGLYCTNHKNCKQDFNPKIDKSEESILNNNDIILHLNQKKKEKKKKKKLRYKNNKILKKKINEKTKNNINTNLFDYNKILNEKKGFLFKEDNIWYTYNLYEQKIKSNCTEGVICSYCGFVRYTSGGPCIYRNCENRKYGDTEFNIYKKINGKELISIYNKNIENITMDTIL